MIRRQFLTTGLLALGVAACDAPPGGEPTNSSSGGESQQWRMPDEGDRHTRTWMAFGASAQSWGKKPLPTVRRDLATVATTIARFEPVSMLVRQDELDMARELIGPTVDLVVTQLDDLWMRDTGPVFVRDTAARLTPRFVEFYRRSAPIKLHKSRARACAVEAG